MLPFQIKICGITSSEDAMCACQAGADAIGLNFYEPSPRFVDADKALLIAESVDKFTREALGSGNPSVKKIGVFVGMPNAEIASIAFHIGLDGIQLHGDELPGSVESIRRELEKTGHHCLLIRAIRSQPEDLCDEIKKWEDSRIDLILLDAAVPGEYGGTGHVVDWESVRRIKCGIPIVLAGGLTPENVSQSVGISGVRSVDVASGVESTPGVKDHDKVRAFVKAARDAFAEK